MADTGPKAYLVKLDGAGAIFHDGKRHYYQSYTPDGKGGSITSTTVMDPQNAEGLDAADKSKRLPGSGPFSPYLFPQNADW